MYLKSTPVFFASLFFCIISFGQNKVTDSTATVLGYWKKGEKISLNYKIRKQKLKEDKITNDNTTTYKVSISVIDESPESYTLEWKCSDIKITGTEAGNPVVAKYASLAEGLVIRYKTDANGSFTELLNWEEIQKFSYATIDRIFAGMNSPEIKSMVEQAKQSFSSKESIEQITAKEVQLYHNIYGGEYKLNEKLAGETQLPNFLGGPPFDATLHIEMKALDKKNNTCNITVKQTLDKEKVTKILQDWMKTLSKEDISLPQVDIADDSEYVVDLTTGWIKGLTFRRQVISDDRKNIETTDINKL